jgi:3-oxoacyl-[acyl-carrier-protein] synthase II
MDKDRDGFRRGCRSILEEYEHAIARATIYCEIGGGMSADAYHITAPHPDGLGRKKNANCRREQNDVDGVNMHTSTPLGDLAE